MVFLYRLWGYLLPFPMWLAEQFIRASMAASGSNEFFPPSLAAIALGMIIPVLSPIAVPRKGTLPLPPDVVKRIKQDEVIRMAGMVLLFIGTLLWLLTVYLSAGGSWPYGWVRVHPRWIASTLYFSSVLLNEAKEYIR